MSMGQMSHLLKILVDERTSEGTYDRITEQSNAPYSDLLAILTVMKPTAKAPETAKVQPEAKTQTPGQRSADADPITLLHGEIPVFDPNKDVMEQFQAITDPMMRGLWHQKYEKQINEALRPGK